ncbi:hypothetical protein EDB92DRAFT_1846386 [Lactarius akahatsu]|uniref:DUF7918 domain-containing protein n=1 Tax=Lactarius akahatsu TaxID=416441 RepID=A0AAD4QFF0_9AGAM|nr:hypothetical protein EDB92DRAFT_1846386 [Lactarius akahatsu]
MLRLYEFSAWISCDGIPLPVFQPIVDANNSRVTCWIACDEGETFRVHWRDEGSKVDTAAYITLDDYKVPGRYLWGEGETSRGGIRTGPNTERPFTFDNFDEESADTERDHTVERREPGTIVLRIRRISLTRVGEPNPTPHIPPPAGVGEEGADLRVVFGSPVPAVPQTPTIRFESYDKENPGSYVTFVFRYRTQHFLISRGLFHSASESMYRFVPVHPPSTPGSPEIETNAEQQFTQTNVDTRRKECGQSRQSNNDDES